MKLIHLLMLGLFASLTATNAHAQVSESASYGDIQTGTAEQNVILHGTDLWGHNDARHGGNNEQKLVQEGSQCVRYSTSPAFMNTQDSNTKKEALSPESCRSYRIAEEIKKNLGSCKPKQVENLAQRIQSHSLEQFESMNLHNDCLCFKTQSRTDRYSGLASAIMSPLNTLFNGPEYHRVRQELAGTLEECLPLFETVAEKAVVTNAFNSVK